VRSELLVLAVVLAGCDEKNEGPAPERFASVKKKVDTKASTFCEKSWAPKERKFVAADVRPGGKWDKPGRDETAPAGVLAAKRGWTWVNLWATWCKPCVEEMGLLVRWNEAFQREELHVAFDLLSIDEGDVDLEPWRQKNLAGHISWIKSQEAFAAFLEGLTVDKNAAIPIHVLVDPDGWLRCVRVGSIKQENYGAVRALIAGG
jgi:thiol-disulfide isomerase/thioredoxin